MAILPLSQYLVIGPLWESRLPAVKSHQRKLGKENIFLCTKTKKETPDEIKKVFICINFQERICMYYILKNEGWLTSLGTIVVTPRDSGWRKWLWVMDHPVCLVYCPLLLRPGFSEKKFSHSLKSSSHERNWEKTEQHLKTSILDWQNWQNWPRH